MADYQPKPIDTSAVTLDAAQAELIERLAANAHEVWASERMREGWRWGKNRDDDRKEHPCLVPYADLPESEKDMDRAMVEQAIKSAIALGYRVAKG